MSDWELLSDDPLLGVRRYVKHFDPPEWIDGQEVESVIRTEYYAADAFMEANKAEFKESIGQRWGNGRKVASIPMHIWSREIAPRVQDGNNASIKRFLNDTDNEAFRTFRGKV